MTAKQARFVQEYLVDLNAAAAARRAGYSDKTANRIASENLSKPDIRAAIRQAMQDRSRRLCIDQDYVLEKLREIADQRASDAPDIALKYSSKLKALELLVRHLGLFNDRLQVAGSIDTGKLDSILAQLGPQSGTAPREAGEGPQTKPDELPAAWPDGGAENCPGDRPDG